jgi:hypothetical protein
VAFKCGLVRGVVAVLLGVSGDGSEWRGSTVVAVGEIGCRYERESFEKLDFLIKLFSKCFLRGAGKC